VKAGRYNGRGIPVARAFLPNASEENRKLTLYPYFFKSKRDFMIKTLTHEFGHILGLRHTFAPQEKSKALLFGTHDDVSIMNYGVYSILTSLDVTTLRELYGTCYDEGFEGKIQGWDVIFCPVIANTSS